MHCRLVAILATLAPIAGIALACGNGASTPQTASSRGTSAERSVLPPQPTFTASAERGGGDAIGFCAKYGTVDSPAQDARYKGSPLPLQITEILRAQPSGSYARPSDYYVYTAWRCMDGYVYTCTHGQASCTYAAPSDPLNSAMASYCQQNPQASYIPDDVVGVPAKLAYQWVCVDGAPKADRKHHPLDGQGFVADEWGRLPQP
jgi:hypothetical protein